MYDACVDEGVERGHLVLPTECVMGLGLYRWGWDLFEARNRSQRWAASHGGTSSRSMRSTADREQFTNGVSTAGAHYECAVRLSRMMYVGSGNGWGEL